MRARNRVVWSMAMLCVGVVSAIGCGEATNTAMGGSGGEAGTGGVAGTGAMGGNAGSGGYGGAAGAGGAAGTGGTAGSGGVAGAGGMGGSGGAGGCVTNNLCTACPDRFLCEEDSDCFVGWGCFPSGCTKGGGAPFSQCLPLRGTSSCSSDDDCPTPSAPSPDYTCENVPNQGPTCVRQIPGCSSDADCVQGFSCESGECIDRRLACVFDSDCPVNYSCEQPTVSTRFCIRIHESCGTAVDCGIVAPFCTDVEGDGRTECVGPLDLDGPACRNSSCGGSAPVCEASSVGSIAACGQYGLCRSNADCADATFECRSLWPDGRKECVKRGGSCDAIEDCELNQVCAVARTGGAPACQDGIGL